MARAEPSAGDVIADKFRVERVLGRGGMGLVIEATNLQLDQRVALKLLAGDADDASVVERLGHEARAAARLKSDHVARVYDVVQDAERGPFIVMELLEGRTLAEAIASSGRVPLHRAAEYVIDACEGLAEAHARGIIHLDVKPANLFLVDGPDGKPTIKLLDFGIAAMRSKGDSKGDSKGEAESSSSSQRSVGTPAYLSPEQLRRTAVDHRADVWSLGCVLYELLVGDRPFRAARFTELVTKILETDPEPFPADVDVPPAVQAIVRRCLERDPPKRFASTGELALALLPFARRRAYSAATRAVAHVKSGGLDPDLVMPSSMPPAPSDGAIELASSPELRAPSVPSFAAARRMDASARRRRWPVIALAVVGGLIVAAFVLVRLAAPRGAPAVTSSSSSATSSATPVMASAAPSSTAMVEPVTTSTNAPSEDAASAATSAADVTPPEAQGTGHRPSRRPAPRPSSAPSAPATDGEIRHAR